MNDDNVSVDVPKNPQKGDVRWYNDFGQFVILTHYESDDDWYFRFNHSNTNYQGQTKWSEMPIEKPVTNLLRSTG